jgi:hypothetical protein
MGGASVTGAGGASGLPEAGLCDGDGDGDGGGNGDEGGGSEAPVAACTALAECCSRFATEDPAQGWCQASLTEAAGPERCQQMLAFWGC